MKKHLILINILLFSLAYTQITYKISIKEKISNSQFIVKIDINNISSENYIIPIDTTGFKASYPDEMCSLLNSEYPYKYLSPTIILQNNKNKQYMEPYTRTYDVPEESISRIEKHIDSSLQKRKILINDWVIKENIKDIKTVEKNFYLMENLIALKSKTSFSCEIFIDLFTIKRSELLLNYDSYVLGPNNEYLFSSIICIDKKVYSYLTKKQKKKFKKYKLFSGKIESNKIEIKQ